MKREARSLLSKGLHSLTVSIDHFNSSSDVGRTDAVLIALDHSLEMLLKASILHRGGEIRDKPTDKCAWPCESTRLWPANVRALDGLI